MITVEQCERGLRTLDPYMRVFRAACASAILLLLAGAATAQEGSRAARRAEAVAAAGAVTATSLDGVQDAAAQPAETEGPEPPPAARLGPLLGRRVAALAAAAPPSGPRPPARDGVEGLEREAGSKSAQPFVAFTIYVDEHRRLADLEKFLADRGAYPGTSFAGGAADLFGGALTASAPVSLLLEIAARPGVRYLRERHPPRIDRAPPEAGDPPPLRQGPGGEGAKTLHSRFPDSREP